MKDRNWRRKEEESEEREKEVRKNDGMETERGK